MNKLVLIATLTALSGPVMAKDVLRVFNWNNEIAPETIKRFEALCQCSVQEDYYGDNEEMLAKLAAGASGVGACIDASKTTELIAVGAYLTSANGQFDAEYLRQCALAGGDDYELAFTAAPERRGDVAAAAQASATAVTRIGVVQDAPGLRLIDAQGRPLTARYASFDHFA